MARIGLISDTHGFWDPAIPGIFNGVSHIIHAGDIGSESILQKLRDVAPLTVVKGNTDTGSLAVFPEFVMVEILGMRIFVTHAIGKSSGMKTDVSRAIYVSSPDIVVYGHTHNFLAEKAGDQVFINPGAAGVPGIGIVPRTVADIDFGDEFFYVNFFNLEAKSGLQILDSRLFPI